MYIKYQIKKKLKAKMELKDWENMFVDYLERVNFDIYPLVDWDEIAKNAGYDSVKDQGNIFCVKQYSSGGYPVGSLVIRHKPMHYDPKLNKLSIDVDIYVAEPQK